MAASLRSIGWAGSDGTGYATSGISLTRCGSNGAGTMAISKRLMTVLATAVVAGTSLGGHAEAQVFSDRSAFDAAVNVQVNENFSSLGSATTPLAGPARALALARHVGARVFLNEPISVRHLHSRQCLRVENGVFRDDTVHVQDVSGNGIDL